MPPCELSGVFTPQDPWNSPTDQSVHRLLEAFVLVAAEQIFRDSRRVGNEAGLDLPEVEPFGGLVLQPPDQGGLAVSPRAVKQYGLGIPLSDLEPAYKGAQMVFLAVPPRKKRR